MSHKVHQIGQAAKFAGCPSDEKILIAFGKYFQKIRKSRKISVRKLKALADVNYSEIHRIEKGLRNPFLTTILPLAKALNVTPSGIIEGF